MTWLNWSLKFHSKLRIIPHLIHTHTTHKSNVQWISISFMWLYMFKCNVCVLNLMWNKPKRFLFVLFAFGSDLSHPYFSKIFKLFLCEKHIFWVFLWPFSCVSSVASYMVKFLSFSTLDGKFHDYFVSKAYPWKISWEAVSYENFQLPTKISRLTF